MRREDVQRGWECDVQRGWSVRRMFRGGECEKGRCSEEGEKFTTSFTSLYT